MTLKNKNREEMCQGGQDRGVTPFGDRSHISQAGFLQPPVLTSSCSQSWTSTKHFPAQVFGKFENLGSKVNSPREFSEGFFPFPIPSQGAALISVLPF